MNNFPTRQQVDRAAPLHFDERAPATAQPAEKQANITIEVAPDGLHIKAEYTGTLASIPQAIERLRAAGVLDLVRAGKVAAPPIVAAPAAPTRKAAKRVEPEYSDAGEACCPVHHKPLAEGRYGLYCPSRADGEHANAKGYCNIRFAE